MFGIRSAAFAGQSAVQHRSAASCRHHFRSRPVKIPTRTETRDAVQVEKVEWMRWLQEEGCTIVLPGGARDYGNGWFAPLGRWYNHPDSVGNPCRGTSGSSE
eukprot:m.405531 g.405531  ORF g.405531 m.405531 type:complete len:102 (+) comp16795_c1_seq12:220-525(+)